MNLLEKVKLLFRIKTPIKKVLDEIKEIRRGYKSIEFWISLIGSLTSLIAALEGFIPPHISLIITTILASVYNIIRGLKKSQEEGIRNPIKATEFWIGLLAILQTGLLQIQSSGISQEWITLSLAIIAGAMATAQNMAAKQPVIDK